MKTTLLTVAMALLIPTVSMAKVEDFNAMITANGNAQKHLQTELNGQVEKMREAQNAYKSESEEDSGFLQTINTPTDKGFMTFRKETVQYRASEAKQMERLANEISAMETQF
jgi:hypothetical protein